MFSGVRGTPPSGFPEVSHPEFIHSGDCLSWFIHSFTQRGYWSLNSYNAALSMARGPKALTLGPSSLAPAWPFTHRVGVVLDLGSLQSVPCGHLQFEVPSQQVSGLLPTCRGTSPLSGPPKAAGLSAGCLLLKDRPWGWILLPGCSSQSLLGADVALTL